MTLAVFWTAVALIVLTYVLIPLLILLRGRLCRRPFHREDATPAVSVVIAAYNEAASIAARIENLRAVDYPRDRLQIVVASDGSTDRTETIVRELADRNTVLLALPRQGKWAAINRAVEHATGEVLVFTDANTSFAPDAVRALVRPLADARVGGVAGNQVYLRDGRQSLTADGEQAYWSFDRMIKQAQSHAGSVTSATGAIYALRRGLFSSVPGDAMDDFMISTGVVAQGYRLVFAADALAYEPVAVRGGVEYSRKVRVMTQGLRAVAYRRALLNPLRHGVYAVQLLWHKVLRRLMVFPLMAVLITSVMLWPSGRLYQAFATVQIGFYACALMGMMSGRFFPGRLRSLAAPYYFCLVNVAALEAVFHTVCGNRIQRWEPERHQAADESQAASDPVQS